MCNLFSLSFTFSATLSAHCSASSFVNADALTSLSEYSKAEYSSAEADKNPLFTHQAAAAAALGLQQFTQLMV